MTPRATARAPRVPQVPGATTVPGHVPPPPDSARALLGVRRAAVEVATARRRLAACITVAEAAGVEAPAIDEAAAAADAELPAWLPPGGGPAAFG